VTLTHDPQTIWKEEGDLSRIQAKLYDPYEGADNRTDLVLFTENFDDTADIELGEDGWYLDDMIALSPTQAIAVRETIDSYLAPMNTLTGSEPDWRPTKSPALLAHFNRLPEILSHFQVIYLDDNQGRRVSVALNKIGELTLSKQLRDGETWVGFEHVHLSDNEARAVKAAIEVYLGEGQAAEPIEPSPTEQPVRWDGTYKFQDGPRNLLLEKAELGTLGCPIWKLTDDYGEEIIISPKMMFWLGQILPAVQRAHRQATTLPMEGMA
jgi:hypothetical protein